MHALKMCLFLGNDDTNKAAAHHFSCFDCGWAAEGSVALSLFHLTGKGAATQQQVTSFSKLHVKMMELKICLCPIPYCLFITYSLDRAELPAGKR